MRPTKSDILKWDLSLKIKNERDLHNGVTLFKISKNDLKISKWDLILKLLLCNIINLIDLLEIK